MKDKFNKWKYDYWRMIRNFADFLDAIALTAVIVFAVYQALQHKGDSIYWTVLLVASIYCVFQAFRFWKRALDK